MSDSERSRSLLQSTVAGLVAGVGDLAKEHALDRQHDVQLWQFMFGQVPNCKEIEPTPTSYCGMTTLGIANLRRTVLFATGLIVLMNGIEHGSGVLKVGGELLKWAAK